MLLQEKFKDYSIILGSQSPRRKELLAGLKLDFKTLPLNADESYSNDLKREQITEYLCRVKAEVFKFSSDKEILITSDTIVWLNDKAMEKPKGREEAIKMLSELSGNTHEVITSVGITSTEKQVIFSDITEVTFGDLTQEEITFYVDNFQPFDKAGSYGVQEWIGYMGVKNMNGSYFTVMGLPLYPLYNELKRF